MNSWVTGEGDVAAAAVQKMSESQTKAGNQEKLWKFKKIEILKILEIWIF